MVATGKWGLRAETLDHGPNIREIRVSSRWSRRIGMAVSCYRVGHVLVDTGFPHGARATTPRLLEAPVAAVALTHHHEDHLGNAGAVAERFGCPVYLRRVDDAHTEGVSALPLYRRWWWGRAKGCPLTEAPETLETGDIRLRTVPTPGHSATHTVWFDEARGVAFTGDLFVAAGAAALMTHEDPFATIRSLRVVADLGPRLMLTGHALAVPDPAAALRRKADRMERAVETALELHAKGLPPAAIERHLFPRGRTKDRLIRWITRGEFSRRNFVRAALKVA